MTLAALHRPLVWLGRPALALGASLILAIALDGGVALAFGGGAAGGGGHFGGGGFATGHSGGFVGGRVGGFAGPSGMGGFTAPHPAGGRFVGGSFAGGFHQVPHGGFGFHSHDDFHHFHGDFHHDHGFRGAVVVGFPFPFYSVPLAVPYPYYPYPYYPSPYCDPRSPWYNPSYCYWGYRPY